MSFKELFKVLGRLLVVSRQCSLLNHTAPCRIFPAHHIRHPCRLRPQPQPPISSAGPVQVGGDVEIIKERSASTSTKRARPEDQVSVKAKRARSASTSRSSPPLPRGTTLGGLAQPQGHLRPVLNRLSIRLLLPRTLKPLKLT